MGVLTAEFVKSLTTPGSVCRTWASENLAVTLDRESAGSDSYLEIAVASVELGPSPIAFTARTM
jgi:hypothetical protein